jgi:hypothetical protein
MSTESGDDAAAADTGAWAPPDEDGYTHLPRDEILTCVQTSVQNVLSELDEGQTMPDRYKLSESDIASAVAMRGELHDFYEKNDVRQEHFINDDDPNLYRTVTYIKINGEWVRAGESNWMVHLMQRSEFGRGTEKNESQYVVAIKEIWIQSFISGFRWAHLSHLNTLLIAALLGIGLLDKDDCTDLTAFFNNFSGAAGSYKVKGATLHNIQDGTDESDDSRGTSEETLSGSFTERTDSSGTQPSYHELYDPCLYARTRDDDPRKIIITTIQYFLNSAVYSKKTTALNAYLKALLRYNSDEMTIQHYDLMDTGRPPKTSEVEEEIAKLKTSIVNCLNKLTDNVVGIVNTHFDDVMSNTSDWAPYDHKWKKLVDISADDPLSITLVHQVLAAYRGEHGDKNLNTFLLDVGDRLRGIRTGMSVPQEAHSLVKDAVHDDEDDKSDDEDDKSDDEGAQSDIEGVQSDDEGKKRKGRNPGNPRIRQKGDEQSKGGAKTHKKKTNPKNRNKTNKKKNNKKKTKKKTNKKTNKNKKKNKKLNYSAKRK